MLYEVITQRFTSCPEPLFISVLRLGYNHMGASLQMVRKQRGFNSCQRKNEGLVPGVRYSLNREMIRVSRFAIFRMLPGGSIFISPRLMLPIACLRTMTAVSASEAGLLRSRGRFSKTIVSAYGPCEGSVQLKTVQRNNFV